MNPISFSCEQRLELSASEIAEQILDVSKWSSFRGFGPIPGIRAATIEVLTPEIVGTRFKVANTDGSTHIEEIVEWRPERVRMMFKEFSPPLARLATGIEEQWDFQAGSNETVVTRTFRMHAKSALARPILWLLSIPLKKAIVRHMRDMAAAA